MSLLEYQIPLNFGPTLPSLEQLGYYIDSGERQVPRYSQEETDIDPNYPDGGIPDSEGISLLA